MKSIQVFLIVSLYVFTHAEEPQCPSQFDYEYKVVQKLVELEQQQSKLQNTIDQHRKEILELQSENNGLLKKLKSVQQIHQDSNGGDTYVRWGRTSCPENVSELVYKGYAGGSFYNSPGSAVNYLCLPSDPLWGTYNDSPQDPSAFVYGAEYELDQRSGKPFFERELHNHDVPCAVCKTSRSSAVMIPGRNACYGGWTKEYNGYLTAGYYGHSAASEFVCLDEEPEIIEGGSSDQNGILFYLTEARCGSLKCPPYVNGRELTCVVCSK